jgi:F-type H+-transporting ATPase subunit delta
VETSSGIQASLSGRYAKALFDLADEGKNVAVVEASLATLRRSLDESDDLCALTTNPLISRKDAGKAVAAIAQAMELDATTTSFLGVLAENHRLGQLPAVIRAFRRLAAQQRGETSAEVVSAHPLTPAQTDALTQQLRARVGRDVSVDLSVDPALLGGMIVRIGSQQIDSSIRTRLNSLAHAMKG